MDLAIREPRSEEEFELYYDLRWRILREPWTQSRESGRDEHEQEAIHVMAWRGDTLVGVGRVHFNSPAEAQIRYMAVEPQYSQKGAGGQILMELETRARRAGAERIVLNAREAAIPFYRKHGYALVDQSGTLFDSIVHWSMRKQLAKES
ncbi:MAG: GNAT family N-acetyltransferase [Bryobacteraceae bacterium]